MKKIYTKIIGSSIIVSLLIVPMISVKAEDGERQQENRAVRLEDKFLRIERPMLRASTTEKRLENRQENIERIKERLASTTASTSAKRIENLDNRLDSQREQMSKVKDRLIKKELQAIDVLGKIAAKIQERITILVGKKLDMTTAKAKLAEATAKIEAMTVAGGNLATLVGTEITDANKTQLFTDIKTSQDKIKVMAREAHALLVDTVKEITKVLPAKTSKSATTTATSTN